MPPPMAEAATDAGKLVRRFLDLMEARDLAGAEALLAPGFVMVFPGDVRMTRLSDLVTWAKGRYQWVRKSYERFDEAPGQGGDTAVYCFGTLAGEGLDGTAFDGIRFIDRFTIRDGLLLDQRVWNDMAEVRSRASES